MPTVPTYDQLQVTPNTKPLTPVTAPQFRNFAADNAQHQGQAMQQLGGELGRQATEMQLDANHAIVTDAMNASVQHEQELELGDNGYAKLQGRDALDRPQKEALWDEYGTKLDKANADIAKKFLKNDAQRQAFEEITAQRRTTFTTRIMRYAATEQKKYNLSVQKGTIEVANNRLAMSGGDPEVVADSVTAIKGAVMELGRLQGKAKDEIAADMVDALSPGHAAVISSAVDSGRTNFARKYLNAHTAELTPAARLQITELVKTGEVLGRAQDHADHIMASGASDSEKLAAARKITDPKLRDAVVTRVKLRINETHALEKQSRADAENEAYTIAAKGGDVPASLLDRMSGKVRMSLTELAQTGGTVTQDNMEAYGQLSALTPDELHKVNMLEYTHLLKPATIKSFIDKQHAQPHELVGDSAIINSTIKRMGLDDNGKGRIYKQIHQWQLDLGHKPTREELQSYMDGLELNVVTGSLFGIDLHNKVGVLKYDDIPDQYVPDLARVLSDSGKEVSHENMLKAYNAKVADGTIK